MIAASSGNGPSVGLLLDAGADPNAKDVTNGQTALMFAAARNSADAVKLLLARHADPSATTKVLALKRVRVDANGDPLPEGDAKPAAAAAQQERLPGVGFNKDGTPIQRNNDERVFGATVVGGMTALHFAAREGHSDAARALLDGGADVNLVSGGEHTSPMVEAIINGHLDLAKFLLDHGADPKIANIDRLTALYATIDMRWRHNTWYPQPTIEQEKTDYLEFMTELLDRGADINFRLARKLWFRKFRYGDDWVEPIGATAFWRAAQANDVAAMRLLASSGANPNIPTTHGVTPLMVAAGVGFEYQGTNIRPGFARGRGEIPGGRSSREREQQGRQALHHAPRRRIRRRQRTGEIPRRKGADVKARASGRLGGTQGPRTCLKARGTRVADMANGPREKSLLHPETVTLLEAMGSENSHDCRSTACVNNTKAEKPGKKPGQQ